MQMKKNFGQTVFSQVYDLATHTIYVAYVNFIHKWQDMQFKFYLLSEFLPEIC